MACRTQYWLTEPRSALLRSRASRIAKVSAACPAGVPSTPTTITDGLDSAMAAFPDGDADPVSAAIGSDSLPTPAVTRVRRLYVMGRKAFLHGGACSRICTPSPARSSSPISCGLRAQVGEAM